MVNRGKLIAKQLYFQPSSDVEFFDFQVPHDLDDQLFVHISTARGSNIQYSDISITKNDGWWAKSENDNPANVRHLQHSAALVRH